MEVINGYRIHGSFTSENAGFCKWAFGDKGGRQYFIKEFLSPKFPLADSGLSLATIEKKKSECEKFYNQKAKVYREIQKCRTGNVMIIHDFFRDGSKYYAATERVMAESLTAQNIAALSSEKKLTLVRSILYSFSEIHSRCIVHSDVKPDNILIKKTKNDFYTGKIIDFDASFFESDIPEDIQGDQVYLAPEMRLRMMEIPVPITTKADIFALGILFHQYWCGERPGCPDDYDYLFEAVLDGAPISVSEEIPETLRKQIQAMLQKEPSGRPGAAQVLQALAGQPGEPKSRVKYSGFAPMESVQVKDVR